MALATREDVEARLGRSLTATESTRADGLLDEASELVIAFLGCDPTDTTVDPPVVPPAVVIVVSRMVARVLEQSSAGASAGAESTTDVAGPFSQTRRFAAGTTGGSPWLAKTDRLTLRPHRCGGGFEGLALQTEHTGSYQRALP